MLEHGGHGGRSPQPSWETLFSMFFLFLLSSELVFMETLLLSSNFLAYKGHQQEKKCSKNIKTNVAKLLLAPPPRLKVINTPIIDYSTRQFLNILQWEPCAVQNGRFGGTFRQQVIIRRGSAFPGEVFPATARPPPGQASAGPLTTCMTRSSVFLGVQRLPFAGWMTNCSDGWRIAPGRTPVDV